ncbi:hypothetical protein ACJMK2_010362 [Sinanodonta woodiana]|uniref:Rotatin N-terminal domain-containing protein n=1 Tax=Sinanodonta woodiana TaxID=1069815 RepID=A0ABD3VGI4_SINWO
MSGNLRNDVDFHGLFKKLGHHLEEIRVRALENIVSKLDHKLICDADLVQERHLFIRLLEWFNFPNTVRHYDVLSLLQRLSQHTSGAEVLLDIGGIEFLTQLRGDVSPALQPQIDQILENTMRLPDVGGNQHAPECIYQKHDHPELERTLHSTLSRNTAEWTASSAHAPSSFQQEPAYLPDYREPPLGYFGEEGLQNSEPNPEVAGMLEGSSSCFRMTTFPWLALTSTDRHVIVSTNSSLQSREPPLLISTCEFLSDVVFQDFPAEIFLQRPNIVKNLMALMTTPHQENQKLRMHATRTLCDYTMCLKTRIRYYQDPSLYTPKQDFSATSSPFSTPTSSTSDPVVDGRPLVVGWNDTRPRGDGRDGDTSASSSRSSSTVSSVGFSPGPLQEETDFEEMQALKFIQMTLPQFCSTVLEKGLPLLQTNSEEMVIELLYLMNLTLEILSYVVTPAVWEDSSVASREVVDKLTESLETIGKLIKFHHHGNVPFNQSWDDSNDQNTGDLVQHRLAFIGISIFLTKLVTVLVPLEKCRIIVPESVVSVIGLMVYDEALSHSHPDVQVTLLGYLQQLNHEEYQVYVSTAGVCQAMLKTCKFLMQCQDELAWCSKETVTYMESAIPSIPYHCHMPFVSLAIRLCSEICSKTQQRSLQDRCHGVLLKLLAHPVAQVRQHTYMTVLQTLQSSLSVNKAVDPGSSQACDKAKFLINTDVTYEIILYGLADNDPKVCGFASDVLVHLLRSQLLMSPAMWQSCLQTLLKGLPILQVFSKLRSESLKRLSWFLSNEENSSKKLPVFSELDVTNLANIFIVETPRSVDEDLGRSVFQVDGLRKVYEIFTSLSVDPGVKKSAVDQLAIILQDPTLHTAFRRDGGLEKIMEHIQLGIQKDGDSTTNNYVPYLPACITILRHLIHHDYSQRHKFAHDSKIYYTLLRVALLNSKDQRTCYEISHIFMLLLFDELAKFDKGGGNHSTPFSVPAVLKKRYRLPFRPSFHQETSPHKLPSQPQPDPLLHGAPAEMLRMTWNIAWHNGMDKMLAFLVQSKSDEAVNNEFLPKLKLNPTDKIILLASHTKQGLQNGIYQITNATSHKAVKAAVTRLLSHIVALYDTKETDVFNTLDWCNALGRFVKVTPSSAADEVLLLEILRFISMVLKMTNQTPDNILQWLGEVLYHPKGPLIGLLHRSSNRVEGADDTDDSYVNVKRSLDKALLSFIATYNSKLPYVLCVRLKFHQLRGDLSHKLLQRLNVTDAPHFYNLASLEGTLQCLMHITARPGWSQECTETDSSTLCSQVLSCLLEVVSAFHIGRGGTAMSFMGKGVTKAATLCLRQLAYEMATLAQDKNWLKHWLYSRHGSDAMTDPGLNWMLTLWTYRDPEVRTAGLGIAVTLTSTVPGRILVTSNCKHIPGGIWGAAFSILLDQAECSMVKEQAALLLVNLTSQTMPTGTVDTEQNIWQGPVVTDTEYQVSLIGLTALLALLHHSQFYREMLIVLSNYYPQPSIYPTVSSDNFLSNISGSSSNTTVGSNTTGDAGLMQGSGRFHGVSPTLSSVSSLNRAQRLEAIGSSGRPPQQHMISTTNSSNATTPTNKRQGRESPATGQGDEVTEYQCVTTPCLVAGVSQLLRNLVILAPQDTLTALKNQTILPILNSVIDVTFLDAIQNMPVTSQLELFFCDLIRMHSSILGLLRTCLVYDTSTRMNMLEDKVLLGTIVSLLRITYEGSSDTDDVCKDLWCTTLSFLTTLIQLQCVSAVQVLTQVLERQWIPISEKLKEILEDQASENKKLYSKCLEFLCVVFSEEGKLQARQPADYERLSLTSLLNSPLKPECEDKDEGNASAGARLCKALVSTYDQWIFQTTDESIPALKVHVITALRSLLAISSTAKSTALEMGLVENLIEHVKQTHVKLNMASLQVGKPTSRGKDDPLVQELILTFDLLRNFLYQSEEVKLACYHSGLHNVVHKLWSWCQVEGSLMTCVLALLTTYTAHCPQAASSLAFTSAAGSGNVSTGSKPQLGSNSLVHCLIKLLNKENIKDAVLKGVFGLLATLALSAECKNIIWKSNFLREFSELNPRKTKKRKNEKQNEGLWLELLVNLSFSTEGQQIILKIPDSTDLLLDFMDCGQPRHKELSVLIIRNLCCHTSNKPKLLANEKLIPQLLQCMGSEVEKVKAVAASALWALVFNNQKAKVTLKSANVIPKLQETLNNITNQGESSMMEKCSKDIQSVIATVSE